MRWVPFGFGCVMAVVWWYLLGAGHLSTYTRVTTSLLVGLMMDAWLRIPPRGLEKE